MVLMNILNKNLTFYRFHVDDMSSALVYLRMKLPNNSYEELSSKSVEECAQLTKENSIEVCKKKGLTIIY